MTGWETWLLSPLSVLSRPPLMSLITSQYVSPLQRWPCTTVMFLTLHFLSSGFLAPVLFQGELSPSAPEKREGAREGGGKVESSKVTFGVSPLELVSSWQGGDSFNFSPTVRSSLFFKRLWDRYKQRKTLPDFYHIIWGAFFSPALSLCQKWAFSDSCQIAAAAAAAAMDADGLFSRQIQQSFPRYCKSRPGCFSTCSCPSVIGKSRWLAVWQSSGGGDDEKIVPMHLQCCTLNFPWPTSSIKSTARVVCLLPGVNGRALMWLMDIFIWPHRLPACCCFYCLAKQLTEGKDATSELVLEALTLKGNGNFKENKLCDELMITSFPAWSSPSLSSLSFLEAFRLIFTTLSLFFAMTD